MKEKANKADCGIVVGRFQTNQLHQAHIDLIQSVIDRHDRVIIFLGNSPVRNTFNNPLDFRARRAMIAEQFPNIEIHYITDVPSDELWSKNLDKLIGDLLTPHQSVILYGSRDSFLGNYKGKYTTCELESTTFVSATEIRRQVSNNYPPTKDYRAGMIAATAHRFPVCYQTIDIVVVNDTNTDILIARKPNEVKWRFIGGFSDTNSESLEADAKREVMEEAGVEISEPVYIGSRRISDWRYKNEVDKIKTALFVAKYLFGRPQGNDDVAEVKWVKISSLKRDDLVDEHKFLLDMFIEKWVKNNPPKQTEIVPAVMP